jgi:asparagine synthase (glutamine-hydrolysing)
MCAIAGIYNYHRDSQPVDRAQLKRMADVMAHRGPDDEGFFSSGPVGLAHRRLSIIDLTGGHQPMFNEDGSIVLVFNGEIYNHRELRAALESKGHVYRTHADTESIIHTYEEYGDDFEAQLTGMFAFALWDARRRRLVLSRDRLGIKPLYYTQHQDQLLFASEIKALLSVTGVARRVDLDALESYLTVRYVPGPKTMFKDIYRLQPGHTLTVQNEKLRIHSYWDLEYTEEPRSEEELSEELGALLVEVCRSHLMTEVPYGVLLSGGLDSSTVVAVLRSLLDDRLATFTIGYDNADHVNEFAYARKVSEHADTWHREVSLPAKEFADWIPKLVWHLDEPIGDPACVPLYFVARYAKQHATVLHSGEGADELFAGYGIYQKMLAIEKVRANRIFPLIKMLSNAILPLSGAIKGSAYLRLLQHPLQQRYRGVSGHYIPHYLNHICNADFIAKSSSSFLSDAYSSYYQRVRDQPDLNQMLYVDTKVWLPDDLLIKADKMTMAASVELRVPFLDHRLVEFAARLPVSYKLRGTQGKFLLKKVMESFLPRDIIYRRKSGFALPLPEWFRKELYELARHLMLRPGNAMSTFLNLSYIEHMLERHRSGVCDFSFQLWALLLLEYWFEEYHVAA